jgi:hypothetical protein
MRNEGTTLPATVPPKRKQPSPPDRLLFTKPKLDKLRSSRPSGQRTVWDTKQPGLQVLVSPGAAHAREATVTFRCCYYLRPGKPRYTAIGRYGVDYPGDIDCSDIAAVRDRAAEIRINAKKGVDPKRPKLSDAFEDVVKNFIELHAKKNNRSWRETQRIFNTYVLPEWRNLSITQIKRRDVSDLLDKIESKKIKRNGEFLGGAVTADATLAALSKLFNWHATRTDDFVSPIVRGMRRAKSPKERARQRIVSDHELRVMWPILSDMGTYGAAVKCMLLTAQRVKTVGRMRRSEIVDGVHDAKGGPAIDHVWLAPRDDAPKNKGVSVVPLSRMARKIIDTVPIIDADRRDHEDFVFSLNGHAPLNGWSKYKERLDRKMLAALREQAKDPDKVKFELWQLRDLRRTARTLMSRAGVSTEIAERALGHVMSLVRGTYDRYSYLREKAQAFEQLANLVERIVNPKPNVVKFSKREKRGG